MAAVRRFGVVLVFLFLVAACAPTSLAPTSAPHGGETPGAVPPTPTPPLPTAVPPTVEPTPPPDGIVLAKPQAGDAVFSPVEVRGTVSLMPFENTLLGRVYDARGALVGAGPIEVVGDIPGPGTFAGRIPFSVGEPGPGKVEVADISPKDGTVEYRAVVDVLLAVEEFTGTIEVPTANAEATLPLHILARVGKPGDQVMATLRWADGQELSRRYILLEGEDGGGLLVESLWWDADVPPLPFPATQPAALEIRRADGTLLARQELTVISWDDPEAQTVTVYFLLGEVPTPVKLYVPKTVRVGTAALEELLWGPPTFSEAGFITALPLPREVLSYPGRGPDWGPRVRLLNLTIEDGVALADFSRELKAYGGGSARVLAISEQITRTLLEFPTVQRVVIAIEGETEGVLEP